MSIHLNWILLQRKKERENEKDREEQIVKRKNENVNNIPKLFSLSLSLWLGSFSNSFDQNEKKFVESKNIST